MEEILHQLIGIVYPMIYMVFKHPRWRRISSVKRNWSLSNCVVKYRNVKIDMGGGCRREVTIVS